MRFLELFLGAIVLWHLVYKVGNIIFNREKITLKTCLSILVFSLILSYINYINLEGVIKILLIYYLFCLYFRIIFKEEYSKIIVSALIVYIGFIISEIVVIVSSSFILELFNVPIAAVQNSLIMNILISFGMFILICLIKTRFKSFVYNSDFKNRSKIIIIIAILINLALLGYKLPVSEWKLSGEFIVTMFILLIFCIVGIYMIKQNSEMQKKSKMYNEVVEYSKNTNKLLEDYRLVNHEHKNQLSIIRTMIKNDNKELVEYVDNLLENKNITKYNWISDLNHLPLEGLKGLINYKLLEMDSNKIKIAVSISKEVSSIRLDKLSNKQIDNLYSIIGVYLDNAMQASKLSTKKEVSIEIYKENKTLVIIIGNTYKGRINIEKLGEYGYTTRGKKHGVGLYMVKQIIANNNLFSEKRLIQDKYYIQELRVNLSKIRKIRKNK